MQFDVHIGSPFTRTDAPEGVVATWIPTAAVSRFLDARFPIHAPRITTTSTANSAALRLPVPFPGGRFPAVAFAGAPVAGFAGAGTSILAAPLIGVPLVGGKLGGVALGGVKSGGVPLPGALPGVDGTESGSCRSAKRASPLTASGAPSCVFLAPATGAGGIMIRGLGGCTPASGAAGGVGVEPGTGGMEIVRFGAGGGSGGTVNDGLGLAAGEAEVSATCFRCLPLSINRCLISLTAIWTSKSAECSRPI